MKLLDTIKQAFTAPLDAYRRYEAAYPVTLAESLGEAKKVVRVGGTGMALNQGDWVSGNTPGNLYSNWAGYRGGFSGTRLNYANLVGPLHQNTAYMACLQAYMDAFSQAPVCLKEQKGNEKVVIEPNDRREEVQVLLNLFETINQEDDAVGLIDATLIDFIGPGNAYWLVTSDVARTGYPRELQYIPACYIRPITARDQGRRATPGEPLIIGYEMMVDGFPVPLAKEEVIHLRLGKDPAAPHLGLGRGEWLRREIFADNEGTNYTSSILYQMGVAQRIIQPKMYKDGEREMVAPFDPEAIGRVFETAATGDNRGKTLAFESLFEIHESESNPEKMALDKIRRFPESRVAAVTRVPAMVAGLLAGEGTRTYSNYQEAREAFWQDSVLPMMRRIRSQVTRQLIWRNARYQSRTIWFGFNYDPVPALQVDEQARDENIRENWKAGLIDAKEARTEMGLKPKEGDEGRMYADPSPNQPAPADGAPVDNNLPPVKAYVSPLERLVSEIEALDALDQLNGHSEALVKPS